MLLTTLLVFSFLCTRHTLLCAVVPSDVSLQRISDGQEQQTQEAFQINKGIEDTRQQEGILEAQEVYQDTRQPEDTEQDQMPTNETATLNEQGDIQVHEHPGAQEVYQDTRQPDGAEQDDLVPTSETETLNEQGDIQVHEDPGAQEVFQTNEGNEQETEDTKQQEGIEQDDQVSTSEIETLNEQGDIQVHEDPGAQEVFQTNEGNEQETEDTKHQEGIEQDDQVSTSETETLNEQGDIQVHEDPGAQEVFQTNEGNEQETEDTKHQEGIEQDDQVSTSEIETLNEQGDIQVHEDPGAQEVFQTNEGNEQETEDTKQQEGIEQDDQVSTSEIETLNEQGDIQVHEDPHTQISQDVPQLASLGGIVQADGEISATSAQNKEHNESDQNEEIETDQIVHGTEQEIKENHHEQNVIDVRQEDKIQKETQSQLPVQDMVQETVTKNLDFNNIHQISRDVESVNERHDVLQEPAAPVSSPENVEGNSNHSVQHEPQTLNLHEDHDASNRVETEILIETAPIASQDVSQPSQTEDIHNEEDVDVAPSPRRTDDYASALRDLSEAVRSLLPLREHMAIAAECHEGREAAMHNVVSEMRGRMVKLEQQLSSARQGERECYAEAQATRALGLEARLADCQARLEERKPPKTIIRVEVITRRPEDVNEQLKGAPLQQLVTLFEETGSQLVSLVSGLETTMTSIHSISKETLKFVESVQESENDDAVQNEELTRLTALLNVSEAKLAALQEELDITVINLRKQCHDNATVAENACKSSIVTAAAAARAQCDSESARLQVSRLGYIVQLHAEHNTTLRAAQEACKRELDAFEIEAQTKCEAAIAYQLAVKEEEYKEECRANATELRDDATQEQNVTIANVQSNCDDALAAMQERCDAELRLHLRPDIDIRVQKQDIAPEPCTVPLEVTDYPTECKGFNESLSLTAELIEHSPDEISMQFNNRLYVVSTQKVASIDDAWLACRARGMWLLTLDTAEEQADFVSRVQMLLEGSEAEYSIWIAAKRISHWFHWRCGSWVTPWAPQNINNNDECLVLAFPRQLGGRTEWRSARCDEPQQLACEVRVLYEP